MTLVARATAAKIRLRRIKHRRVQTAAVGLCLRAWLWLTGVDGNAGRSSQRSHRVLSLAEGVI